MFSISEWLTESLISGVRNGVFAREYVAMLAANYMLKGLLTNEQVERIANETVPATVEESEEEPDAE